MKVDISIPSVLSCAIVNQSEKNLLDLKHPKMLHKDLIDYIQDRMHLVTIIEYFN
jgi:hypothetical protein